ncbi:MAG: GTPase Era [Oscillospiraceae bacterium]|nr:GTPase Era [Oscillospiraceae bacterium]
MINNEGKVVFAAIVGRANAGKSSLLNELVGERIAAVTSKPQTTRTRITGIVTKDETQYVFVDTPGVHNAKTRLGSHMNKAARDSASGVDLIIMVADAAKKIGDIERGLVGSFKGEPKVALLLNKIDLISDKSQIAHMISDYSSLYHFEAIIPASILKKDGINLIWKEIEKQAVKGAHYFPEGKLTDQPEKVLISEMIREKILICMRDEIPHGAAVVIEELSERANASGEAVFDIFALIYCEKDSHKGMIIGKGGTMLKKIGEYARKDLERFFEIKVNLQCRVKVKEDWRNKEALIRNFGLDGNGE